MVNVRAAIDADAKAIARIHRTARARAMPWLPVLHTPAQDLTFFRDHVLPTRAVKVAEVDGDVVGFIASSPGWIDHLYVTPDYWRAGIGTALVAEPMRSSDALQLWTFQANPFARNFYVRLGFTEVEFTDGSRTEEKTPDVRLT